MLDKTAQLTRVQSANYLALCYKKESRTQFYEVCPRSHTLCSPAKQGAADILTPRASWRPVLLIIARCLLPENTLIRQVVYPFGYCAGKQHER